MQGRPLHVLKDHAHWVTTLALNTDFVLRTGPFDRTGKKPANDEEGMRLCFFVSSFPTSPHLHPFFSKKTRKSAIRRRTAQHARTTHIWIR